MGIYNTTRVFFGKRINENGETIPDDCEQKVIGGRERFIVVKSAFFQFDPHNTNALAREINDLDVCDLKREGFEWFQQTTFGDTYGPPSNPFTSTEGDVKQFKFPTREEIEKGKEEYRARMIMDEIRRYPRNKDEIDRMIEMLMLVCVRDCHTNTDGIKKDIKALEELRTLNFNFELDD